jgi:hypothetical protein
VNFDSFELVKLYDSVQDEIQNKQSVLAELVRKSLNEKNIINNLDQLTAAVNEELFSLTYNSKEIILSGIDNISNDTEQKLGLCISVNKGSVDNIRYDRDSEISLDIEKRGTIEKSITVGRSIMMNSSGGGAISAVVGGVIGAAIGLFGGPVGALTGAQYGAYIGGGIGGLLGGSKGILDGVKHLKEADIPSINKSYTNYITTNLTSIKNMIAKTKTEISQGLVNELNTKIKTQRNQINENIKDIQENMTISKEMAAEKVKIVQEQSRQLNEIELRVNKLMEYLRTKADAASEVQKQKEMKSRKPESNSYHQSEEQAKPQKSETQGKDNFAFLRM